MTETPAGLVQAGLIAAMVSILGRQPAEVLRNPIRQTICSTRFLMPMGAKLIAVQDDAADPNRTKRLRIGFEEWRIRSGATGSIDPLGERRAGRLKISRPSIELQLHESGSNRRRTSSRRARHCLQGDRPSPNFLGRRRSSAIEGYGRAGG